MTDRQTDTEGKREDEGGRVAARQVLFPRARVVGADTAARVRVAPDAASPLIDH